MPAPLQVDIWSDIACPWCYIGKRKFERGLADFDRAADVTVRFHSYELAPDTPVDFDGTEVDFLTEYKGMDGAQVQQMLARVAGIAASVGLDYHFDRVRHTRTLHAHEAIHHAAAHGRQLEMVERLFRAYFVEGRHVGHVDALAELAAEIGLDRAETLRALEAGEHAAAVQADLDQAQVYGITAVPFYVLDGRYGIAGAQEPSVFTAALAQARDER
jgi:predicted DsbA family dithiol-disulfide isomerase